MRKYLNTLFVSTQGAYLNKEGETVVITADRKRLAQIPLLNLDGIVCFGRVSCSPFLMGACADRDVAVSFMTENGRFLASVRGAISGNVLLRREQFRRADSPDASADIARSVLVGKLANSRAVLQRALRDRPENSGVDEMSRAVGLLGRIAAKLREEAGGLDRLRGFEGDAARIYFSVFDHLIISQKNKFRFNGRNRRPPLDNVNCLLSFVYTLLVHDVRSALESAGLDSAVGYLHRDRPGRPGLALDMMEGFRPFLADRLVLSLINRKQVKAAGFKAGKSGAVLMNDATRKTVLEAYQKRKQDEITHPFLEEKMPVGMLFFAQALLLARYLRGDTDAYPPFVWK